MPEEDQKLYAEIVYSWLITRADEIKRSCGVDYLFCVLTDDTCETQFSCSAPPIPERCAALVMMACRILLADNAVLGKSPAEILSGVNTAICGNNTEGVFVTVWLGVLELCTGKLMFRLLPIQVILAAIGAEAHISIGIRMVFRIMKNVQRQNILGLNILTLRF